MNEDFDLTAYLTGKGHKVRKASGAEVVTNCFFCGESKRQGKLYLNTGTWLYDCKVCGERGNRKTLLRHFGDEDNVAYTPGTDPYLRRVLLEEAATLAHEMLLGNEAKLEYLLGRGLSPDTIIAARLGYVPRNFSLARSLPTFVAGSAKIADLISAGLLTPGGTDFLNDSLTIPYSTHGYVVSIREKKQDGKYRTAGGESVRLYNEDALRAADEVIITEGEYDALALQQALQSSQDPRMRAIAVVAVPGALAWPADLEDRFDTMKHVFIGLDPDMPGREGASKMKALLGTRARIIDLPRDLPKCDWSDYLRDRTPENPHGGHDWRDVRTLVVEADLAGKRMFTIGDAAAKWERNKVETPGVKLGWATLDAILRPGLKPGQVMIPLAKTGCIQGDAEVVVNRGGKSFRITMRDLVHRINGGLPDRGPRKPWDPRIETYVQRAEGGTVRLGKIKYAWASGVKTTWEVTTETGRKVRATDEHPFLTEAGWSRLDEIEVGTRVAVNAGRSSTGRGSKPRYFYRSGLVGHPYANRRNVKAGGTSVPFHRIVAEAQLNGISVDDLLARCRDGNVVGLTFLDPAVYAVHHCDHDPHNNDPANLKVLTHAEHAVLHAAEGTTSNVLERVQYERVVSVRLHGEEETYDIEVEDDPHNYIANGFVVHNTGKTVWLTNVVHNTRHHRTLFLSLELTSAEVYEQLHRVHHFWNPTERRDRMMDDYSLLRIVDQNRLNRGDLATLVHEYTEDVGAPPELLIIDYLGYYARGFKGGASAYERLSDAVMDIKAVAKEFNVAVISPHQVNRTAEDGQPLDADDARDSGVIEETGDFVLGLFRPAQGKNADGTPIEDVTGAFNVQLLKSRHGGKGRVFNLRFSAMSLTIVDAVDRKNAVRVEQENADVRRGIHYEDWRKQESTTQLRVV